MATGAELFQLIGHGGVVYDVEASPDGTRWATTSEDGTVRIWDAADGLQSLAIRLPDAVGVRMAFSPDGRHLAVDSFDGRVFVLTLDVEELVDIARRRLARPLTEVECRQYLHLESCPTGP